MTVLELVLSVVVAGATSVGVELVKRLAGRRKEEADTEHTLAETDRLRLESLTGLVDTLTCQVEKLRTQLTEALGEIEQLNTKIRRHIPWDEDMARRLTDAGLSAPPRPPL